MPFKPVSPLFGGLPPQPGSGTPVAGAAPAGLAGGVTAAFAAVAGVATNLVVPALDAVALVATNRLAPTLTAFGARLAALTSQMGTGVVRPAAPAAGPPAGVPVAPGVPTPPGAGAPGGPLSAPPPGVPAAPGAPASPSPGAGAPGGPPAAPPPGATGPLAVLAPAVVRLNEVFGKTVTLAAAVGGVFTAAGVAAGRTAVAVTNLASHALTPLADLARGVMTAAMERLRGELATVRDWAGKLADLLHPVLDRAIFEVTYHFRELWTFAKELSALVRDKLVAAFVAARDAVAPLVRVVRDALAPAFERVRFAFDVVRAAAGNVAERVGEALAPVAERVKRLLAPVADYARTAFALAGTALSTAAAGVRDVLGRVGTALGAAGSAAAKYAGVLYDLGKAYVGVQAAMVGAAGAVAGYAREVAASGAHALRSLFNVIDSGISSININVTRFVSLNNPAAVIQFQYAVDNLYATIGRVLVPVLESFTGVIRSVAAGLNGLTTDGQRVIQAVAAGTVALVAFGAAMAAVEAVATGGIAPALAAVAGALTGLLTASGSIGPMVDSVVKVIGGLFNEVGRLLAAAAPLVQPVLDVFKDVVTGVAAGVAYLAGVLTEVMPGFLMLKEALVQVYQAVKPVFEALGAAAFGLQAEAFRGLANIAREAAPWIALLAEGIGYLVRNVIAAVKDLFALAGIRAPDIKAPQGEQKEANNAVRSVTTGSVESVLQKTREQAFMLAGGGQKPEDKTADNTSQIAAEVASLKENLKAWMLEAAAGIIKDIDNIPQWIYDQVLRAANDVQGKAKQVIGDARDTVNKVVDQAKETFRYAPLGPVGAAVDIYNYVTR